MNFLYSIFVSLFNRTLPLIGLCSSKLKLFAKGRRGVFDYLEEKINDKDRIIWFHCASLGEYEQGVPVMEALQQKYPKHKLLVTFFSPSGYEVKKNSTLADVIVYLPIDTRSNARRFLKLSHPELAVFVKYEFWPNFLTELYKNNIPVTIISAAFRAEQSFFKWYGGFMRKALQSVNYFFVQDETSEMLLKTEGFCNVSVSGDTRFDRVSHQIETNNHIDFITDFVNERLCVVIGSSWVEDESVFVDYINQTTGEVCFVIAPHEIKKSTITSLQQKLTKKTIVYTDNNTKNIGDTQVFIMDAIGYLSRIYSYADIAYVGGAMGNTGLHNILEPATFGVPVIIGKNFEKFKEAKQLQKLAGLFSVATASEFSEVMNKLVHNKKFRTQTGMIAGHFVNSNTGATTMIVKYLSDLVSE